MAETTETPKQAKQAQPTPVSAEIYDYTLLKGGKVVVLDGIHLIFNKVIKDDAKQKYNLYYGMYLVSKVDYAKVSESLFKDHIR